MKRIMMALGTVGLLSLIMVPAYSQQDDDGARQRGRRGQVGARGQEGVQRGPGERGARFGQPGDRAMGGRLGLMPGRGGMIRAYVETNDETREIWIQIRDQQLALHDAQWHLFELLNQDPVNQEAVRAQLEVLRDINTEIRELNGQLEPYRKELDEPLMFGEGFGPRDGQGPGPGWGQERGPREGQGRGTRGRQRNEGQE